MKLSIFTTVTNPGMRGDYWPVIVDSYSKLADELVVMDGSSNYVKNVEFQNHIPYLWPKEFDWPFIGQQFQRGYEACTGDWAIRMDLDMVFHEDEFDRIRDVLTNVDTPVAAFYKRQFIRPDRFNVKSRLILAVNKGRYSKHFRFDGGGDLCQLTLDGRYIEPGDVYNPKIPIWNYECLLKTKEQVTEDVGRMDRAYHRHFGEYLYSQDGTDKSAFDGWMHMVYGRCTKPQERIPLSEHPKCMQETIKNLRPDQFGYDGFGFFEVNSYA